LPREKGWAAIKDERFLKTEKTGIRGLEY